MSEGLKQLYSYCSNMHFRYCEPYIYSFFGLSEYVIGKKFFTYSQNKSCSVLCNIGYHGMVALDFSDSSVSHLIHCVS